VKRAAVVEKATLDDFVVNVIPKSEAVKKIIYDAIKGNILFRACSEEELLSLVDAFESADFNKGDVVIKQGDEGEHFYVVEEGTLDISLYKGGNDNISKSEVQIGVPYAPGSAFGELALMYGSPRAATIRAKEPCKLWCIDRKAFRGITAQHKLKQAQRYVEFLSNVKIGDAVLGDVLKVSEIDAMSLALQRETFKKGEVIVREGERGDIFYVIESGSVDVLKRDHGDRPVKTLTTGQFFGERALLTEDVRQATCVATSEVQCLSLMREDFNLMLGDLQELLDGQQNKTGDEDTRTTIISSSSSSHDVEKASKPEDKIEIGDLEILGTLGIGAFGQVKLVKIRKPVIVCDDTLDSDSKHDQDDDRTNSTNLEQQEESAVKRTYALKMLAKSSILENGLQDHVMTEKRIMEQLHHPFILNFYRAMQDDKHIYFLLEVLLGGELFKFLRQENQFPESWSKFYAASVLLAFRDMHSRKIAYRDLKPENIVLDSNGYLKLVDFGLAKKIDSGKTWTLCGTPDYLAPEVILNEGHDWAVDYWALGVLLYEMTAGTPPFYADDPMEIYEKILSGNVLIPSHFSKGLSDIVKKLLRTYQSKRLGRTKGGTAAVMKHKWFSGFDWDALMNKTMHVPIKPKVKHMEDMSNFDSYPTDVDQDPKPCPQWTPDL
jgi:cGMP-dependent protein kinase